MGELRPAQPFHAARQALNVNGQKKKNKDSFWSSPPKNLKTNQTKRGKDFFLIFTS